MLLPNELLDKIFMLSNCSDIKNWENFERMNKNTFMKKKDSCVLEAAFAGNLIGLKYHLHLVENYICNSDLSYVFYAAISSGNIEVVKYFVELGIPLPVISAGTAVRSGNLDVLKYLHGLGVNIKNPQYTACAIENGDFELIKYLIENNSPFDLISAWHTGQSDLNIAKYIVDNIELDYSQIKTIVHSSSKHGNLEVLTYVVNKTYFNMAYLEDYILNDASVFGNEKILEFLKEKGAKFTDIGFMAINGHLE